jgi:predicted ferric reductase
MSATPAMARFRGLAMLALCCAPVAVWTISVNDPLAYVRWGGLPPGQRWYLAAKLAGLLAICLFWAQCVTALARHIPPLSPWLASDLRWHRNLGIVTALLLLAHVLLFVVATSLRTRHIAWDLLLPDFTHGYYRSSIALGVAAFWLMCLTVFAGWRTMRGGRRWKTIHLLWPLVLGLVFWHALAIGTESRYGAMRIVMWCLAGSVSIIAVWRVWVVLGRKAGHVMNHSKSDAGRGSGG